MDLGVFWIYIAPENYYRSFSNCQRTLIRSKEEMEPAADNKG